MTTLAVRVTDDDIDRAERVMTAAVREAIDAGLRGDDAARYAIARLLADERGRGMGREIFSSRATTTEP